MILFCFAGFLRFDEVRSLTFNDVLVHDDHIALCVKNPKQISTDKGAKFFSLKVQRLHVQSICI